MSPEIIFITLSVANKLRVVCDVIEKEFSQGNKIVVIVEDEGEAKTLDNMLWSWKQSSFIPHNYTNSFEGSNNDPVIITTNISSNASYDILILVHTVDPEYFKNYKKVIDFAEKYNHSKLETDRKRYKLYRDKKLSVETINPGEYLHKII